MNIHYEYMASGSNYSFDERNPVPGEATIEGLESEIPALGDEHAIQF
jgi:hypothetical protein